MNCRMRIAIWIGFLSCSLLLGDPGRLAATEDNDPEKLPLPKPAPAEIIVLEEAARYYLFQRTNRYDVWQHYGVDGRGRFVPRVIYSPFGSYYHINGEPYPWVTTHDAYFSTRVAD